MRVATALAALVLPLFVSAGTFSSANVKTLTSKTFHPLIDNAEKATIAVFFAPWCGHCQKLAPDFEKAARNLKGLVTFAAIDCDDESNRPICSEYGIQGFPTIKGWTGRPKRGPKDYNAARTASAIADWAVDLMPNYMKSKLKTADDVKYVIEQSKGNGRPAAILFTRSSVVTPLFKALTSDFHNDLDLYAVKDSKDFSDIKTELGIEKIPSIVIVRDGRTKLYEGALKFEPLAKALGEKQASSSQRVEL